MAQWETVGLVSDFEQGQPNAVRLGDRAVVIVREADNWYAFADSCPHAGMPLAGGDLRGCVLTCPFHGYTYNIKTGANIDFPDMEPPVPIYAVRVDDDKVMVDMERPTNAEQLEA